MRTKGEGTHYKDGAYYCWALRVGDRRIVRKAKTLGALRQKVIATMQAEKRARSSPMTVARFAELHLSRSKDLTPKTLRAYHQSFKLISSTIGATRLEDLTPGMVDSMGRKLSEDHGSRAAQLAHAFLRSVLRSAEHDGLIRGNPAAIARGPRHKPQPRRYLTASEAARLSEVLPDSAYGLIIGFILQTGLRVNEAVRLSPLDITEQGVLVRKSKTLSGEHRLIPLSDAAKALVDRAEALRARHSATKPWVDSGVLFSTSVGTPLSDRNILRALHAALDTAGLRRVSTHDLRRTFATHLAATGIDEVSLTSIMGHSDYRVTRGHYVDALHQNKAAAIAKLSYETPKETPREE